MGRYSSSGSKLHSYQKIESSWGTWWVISWTVDYYYPGNRLRFPRTFRRDTDEDGVRRFCKKWNLELPKELKNAKSEN